MRGVEIARISDVKRVISAARGAFGVDRRSAGGEYNVSSDLEVEFLRSRRRVIGGAVVSALVE